MQLEMRVVLALSFLVAASSVGFAKCDPSTDPDKTDVANARAAVETNCDCIGAPSRKEYVRCAKQQADAVLVNKSCTSSVKRCAERSSCGKVGFQTCCRTANGRTKCSVKIIGTCTAPKGGSACAGLSSSCCDACTAGGCATPTTTSTTTTTTSSVTSTSVLPPCTALNQPCGPPCGPFGGRCAYHCGVPSAGFVCIMLLGGGPVCSSDADCPIGPYICTGGTPSCMSGGCEPYCF